jgi:hypothetical protein
MAASKPPGGKQPPGKKPPGRKPPARRLAGPAPQPGPPAPSQKYLVYLFIVLAVVSLGFSILLFVDGRSQQAVSSLLVPIAFVVLSRLTPRGWRGGPQR